MRRRAFPKHACFKAKAGACPGFLRALLAAISVSFFLGLFAATAAAQGTEAKTPPRIFPLSVQPGQRYLTDASGQPFLLHGDTAWSLIAGLSREDVDLYLADREARGFNTLLVSLLEHRFASRAPANIYGEAPFSTPGDYATPNERYFAHAGWVLARAAARNFLILLTPSYLGAGGGGEGWYQEMAANGPEKLRAYGRWLGERFKTFQNIVWVQGGDFNPPDKNLVRALAQGIMETMPGALHTAHCAAETAAAEYWAGEPWLALNNVYTYKSTASAAIKQYTHSKKPFFLIESAYENEHEATPRRLRLQAYEALLSGAAGQVFGNNPIWHFDGPGIYPAPVAWKAALASPGAQSMSHLRALFTKIAWWKLVPEGETLFREEKGIWSRLPFTSFFTGPEKATGARAADGSFALIYLPAGGVVTVTLARLAASPISARWFNPANGEFSSAGAPRAPGERKTETFTAPSGGEGDWVLLLEAQ